MSQPVTVLVTRRVRAGREHDFEMWLDDLARVAATFPGHRGVNIVPPPAHASDREYVIMFRFDSQEHLRAWRDSDQRRRMIRDSAPLAEGGPSERELTGMESWFAVPGGQVLQAPAAWKMWLLSSSAIFPLITLLTAFLGPLLVDLPLMVRFAITTPVLGALMTWIVMPRLSRLFAWWLYG